MRWPLIAVALQILGPKCKFRGSNSFETCGPKFWKLEQSTLNGIRTKSSRDRQHLPYLIAEIVFECSQNHLAKFLFGQFLSNFIICSITFPRKCIIIIKIKAKARNTLKTSGTNKEKTDQKHSKYQLYHFATTRIK